MPQKRSYIPQNDAEFNNFFKNMTQYIVTKATGTSAEWSHIPSADQTALNSAYADWYTAYALTTKPHTPPETREKNRVKKLAEKQVRDFVNQYLRYPPVTDQDRDSMGIPIRDGVRTPKAQPTERVAFSFRVKGIREVQVDFRVQGAANKARPLGYNGAVIAWDLRDSAPERPELLTKHGLISRTPYTLRFDETERGKTVYVALSWQNEKGQQGPWSEIQATIVP